MDSGNSEEKEVSSSEYSGDVSEDFLSLDHKLLSVAQKTCPPDNNDIPKFCRILEARSR